MESLLNPDPLLPHILKMCGMGLCETAPSSESDVRSDSSSDEDDLSDADSCDEECNLCSVCYEEAEMRCSRCEDEFYCKKEHQKKHWKDHKKFCKAKISMETDELPPNVTQVSKLVKLEPSIIWNICKNLGMRDLLILGMVCRDLRTKTRDPNAWRHVSFPCYKSRPRLNNFPLLRMVPALHEINLMGSLPEANIKRFPKEVEVFCLDWDIVTQGPPDWKKLSKLLKHFKGFLKVIRLGCLEEIKLLKFIDTLGIHELHIARSLVKVYPGSTKVVTSITLGQEVGGEVLASILKSCRKTLTTFKVDPYRIRKNSWALFKKSPVRPALKRCSAIENASITTMGNIQMINAFPKLKRLCLYEMAHDHHESVKKYFQTSSIVRNLERLTLHLGYQGHRGLIKAAATGWPSLKELRIMFNSEDKMNLTVTVDVPRDLHVILSSFENLETLMLSVARVPCTVFQGLAKGALPSLRVLKLKFCGGTKRAVVALKVLKHKRPGLLIIGEELQLARRKKRYNPINMSVIPAWYAPPAGSRCEDPLCATLSDCDEQDPVIDPGEKNGPVIDVDFGPFLSLNDGSDSDY